MPAPPSSLPNYVKRDCRENSVAMLDYLWAVRALRRDRSSLPYPLHTHIGNCKTGVRSSGGGWNKPPTWSCRATVMLGTVASVDCRKIDGSIAMGRVANIGLEILTTDLAWVVFPEWRKVLNN